MKAAQRVYLVVHHEIFETTPSTFRDDEMVFYVVSSMKTAIDYIKKSACMPYSWWEILEHKIDSKDWPMSLGHYGLRGGKLKSAPFEKSVALFKKYKMERTGDTKAKSRS